MRESDDHQAVAPRGRLLHAWVLSVDGRHLIASLHIALPFHSPFPPTNLVGLPGLRRINTSYSRISFADIAAKLKLDSAVEAEYVCAKNIRDGVIKARLDHEIGAMLSEDQVNEHANTQLSSRRSTLVAWLPSLASIVHTIILVAPHPQTTAWYVCMYEWVNH